MRKDAPIHLTRKMIKIYTPEHIQTKGREKIKLPFNNRQGNADILHTFIAYKIPAKEHEVVDR